MMGQTVTLSTVGKPVNNKQSYENDENLLSGCYKFLFYSYTGAMVGGYVNKVKQKMPILT